MTLKVGIIGMGFMGKCHFEHYSDIENVEVVALCDINAEELVKDWNKGKGNISAGASTVSLEGIDIFTEVSKILNNDNIDIVDITLPTFLHEKFTCDALKSGKHVICEKPMALNTLQADRMIEIAQSTGKQLFIAHCIRFWPEYAKAKEITQSRKYGKTLSANFTRISATPNWNWEWLKNPDKGGSVVHDLHIHDLDFALDVFGTPKSVKASSSGFTPNRTDHIWTHMEYDDGLTVAAEGGWLYAPHAPFEMSFRIAMEEASLFYNINDGLIIYPVKGAEETIEVDQRPGYYHELKHFIECISNKTNSSKCTMHDARRSLKLVENILKTVKMTNQNPHV
jgi:predicted dehydrogenase